MNERVKKYRCNICGRTVYAGHHQCPVEVLRAIDGADTRAARDEIDPTRESTEYWRTEGDRISEGFASMGQSDDSIELDWENDDE